MNKRTELFEMKRYQEREISESFSLLSSNIRGRVRLAPIPKVNQPKTEQNYRPISILPALSKVFERLVSHQVNAYIKDLALFNDSITGFRKGHSTATTLLGIRDDIMRAMRRGEVTLMVLADYSKAFDTINFKSVIHKMHSMGFSQNFLRWILSYLMGRRQFVQINDTSSSQLEIKLVFLRDQSWDLSFSIFMYRIYKGRFSAVVTNTQTTPHFFNILNHMNLTSVRRK